MSDFNSLYEEKLLPQLSDLDTRRLAILKTRMGILLIVLMILLIHGLIILLGLLPGWSIFISVVVFPLAAALVYRRFFDKSADIAREYRETITQESIGSTVDVVDQQPDQYMPYEEFQQSGFFPVMPDHYNGQNMVTGKVGSAMVTFSQVETGFDAPPLTPRSQSQWMPIFNGVFMKAEFKNRFRTSVVVEPDDAEKNLGILGRTLRSFSFERGSAVRTGNTAFSRQFVVYSERPLEALKILSPEVLEHILAFQQEHDADIYLSCHENVAYIAVQIPQPVLPFSLARSLRNPNRVSRVYEQLAFMTDLVRNLDKKVSPPQF